MVIILFWDNNIIIVVLYQIEKLVKITTLILMEWNLLITTRLP